MGNQYFPFILLDGFIERFKRFQAHQPKVVYNEDNGITRAMRNIPGVETAHVDRLNLLRLAPGGTFGRFVIFTEGAFKKLSDMYGTLKRLGINATFEMLGFPHARVGGIL